MPKSYSKPRYRPSRPVHSVGKGYVSNLHKHGDLLGIKIGPRPVKKPINLNMGLGYDSNVLERTADGALVFKDGRNFETGYERTSDAAYKPYKSKPVHDWSWWANPLNPISEGWKNRDYGMVAGGVLGGAAEAAFASLIAAGLAPEAAAAVVTDASVGGGIEMTEPLIASAETGLEEGGEAFMQEFGDWIESDDAMVHARFNPDGEALYNIFRDTVWPGVVRATNASFKSLGRWRV